MIQQRKERTLHHGTRLLVQDSRHTEHLVLAGIRFGKSYLGPVWHFFRVKKNSAQGSKMSLVTAPDYKLAKQVCLTYYKNFLVQSELREGNYGDFRINKYDLTIYFPRYDHTVLTLSGETPEKIMAYTSSHAWNDEAAKSVKDVIRAAASFRNSSYTIGSRSLAARRSPAAAASRRRVTSDMRPSVPAAVPAGTKNPVLNCGLAPD